MKQDDYTMRVLRAEEGRIITQSTDVEILKRFFTKEVYLSVTDSPDNYKEIPQEEAEILRAEQIAALEAKEKATLEAERKAIEEERLNHSQQPMQIGESEVIDEHAEAENTENKNGQKNE